MGVRSPIGKTKAESAALLVPISSAASMALDTPAIFEVAIKHGVISRVVHQSPIFRHRT